MKTTNEIFRTAFESVNLLDALDALQCDETKKADDRLLSALSLSERLTLETQGAETLYNQLQEKRQHYDCYFIVNSLDELDDKIDAEYKRLIKLQGATTHDVIYHIHDNYRVISYDEDARNHDPAFALWERVECGLLPTK